MRRDQSLQKAMRSRYLLLALQSKYNSGRNLQLSVALKLGVWSSSGLVLPLRVGSHTLRFDANMIVSTGGAKAATFTPLVVKTNLLPCCLVYDWTRCFANKWACRSRGQGIWPVKCLIGYINWLSAPHLQLVANCILRYKSSYCITFAKG